MKQGFSVSIVLTFLGRSLCVVGVCFQRCRLFSRATGDLTCRHSLMSSDG